MYQETLEFNFDSIVGPTHNYAGLAPGNLASQSHKNRTSNPRAAALQGLAKMNTLRKLGVPQGVLPPQPRPNLALLRRLGFTGDDAKVLYRARAEAPELLAAAYSSSSMWAANAATVCPSADARDSRVHFTPANLAASLHRCAETPQTARVLRTIFPDEQYFVHHDPLPPSADFGDEGAANHTRFCPAFDAPGVHLFVHGDAIDITCRGGPTRFKPRQTRSASQAVARLHQIAPERVVLAQQHPEAIDGGVFHHDVIGVGHRNLLFCHEYAFAERERTYDALRRATDGAIHIVEVPVERVSLQDAIATYLFNSQIVTTPRGETALVAPAECENHPDVKASLDDYLSQGVFDRVTYIDIKQSMDNGGGPACLRLRVVLTPEEQSAINPATILDDTLSEKLHGWIERYYPEELRPADLADPTLIGECNTAYDQLRRIIDLRTLQMA